MGLRAPARSESQRGRRAARDCERALAGCLLCPLGRAADGCRLRGGGRGGGCGARARHAARGVCARAGRVKRRRSHAEGVGPEAPRVRADAAGRVGRYEPRLRRLFGRVAQGERGARAAACGRLCGRRLGALYRRRVAHERQGGCHRGSDAGPATRRSAAARAAADGVPFLARRRVARAWLRRRYNLLARRLAGKRVAGRRGGPLLRPLLRDHAPRLDGRLVRAPLQLQRA
mmetsp:Transcript_31814/g.100338  ORF Transcript_31814/g.100338 Transcript_31814/m.100338 type:complete len:231 (+) Transcript_31814:755-1447(+)